MRTQTNRYVPGLYSSLATAASPAALAYELLAQLTEVEYEYRQQRKTHMIQAARFRYTASLEELHYSLGRNLDKTAILRLADCGFIDRLENIFLTGATGCGKSYIASALGY